MPDGRFDPDFHRSLVEGRVSASDLAPDDQAALPHRIVPRLWLTAFVALMGLCVLGLHVLHLP